MINSSIDLAHRFSLNNVLSVKRQIPLRLGLEDDTSFENFYASPGVNSDLVDFLKNENPDQLYLYGEPSSGISHLLIALTKQSELQRQKAQYVPLIELLDGPAIMLEQLENLSLICLDDIDLIAESEDWQQQVFHLYNRLKEEGCRFVFGSHSVPQSLKINLADLRSRILSGQTWAISSLEDEDKIAALKRRAELRGFNLSDQVAKYLLGREKRDMSNLMNQLNMLDQLSLQEKKMVTVPLVKAAIENHSTS